MVPVYIEYDHSTKASYRDYYMSRVESKKVFLFILFLEKSLKNVENFKKTGSSSFFSSLDSLDAPVHISYRLIER